MVITITCYDTMHPTRAPTTSPTFSPTLAPSVAPTQICNAVMITGSDYDGIYNMQEELINGRPTYVSRDIKDEEIVRI